MNNLTKRRSGLWRLVVLAAVVGSVCSVSVAFAAGPGINGRVFGQDEEGKFSGVVSGATIEIKDQAGGVAAQTTSDKNGFYKVKLPPGQYFYKVLAAGYKDEDAGRAIRLKKTEGYTVFNFSLTKGENDPDRKPPVLPVVKIGKLHGRVLEKTDRGTVGIPGASVLLRREGSRRLIKVATHGRDMKGEKSGQYEVTLQEGTYRASVVARGFETFVDSEPVRIVSAKDETRDFVLTRYRPEPITEQGIQGTVVVSESGERNLQPSLPPGLDVRLFSLPTHGVDGKPIKVDERGDFKLDLPKGRYRVSAVAKGYKTAASPPTYVFRKRYSQVHLVLRPDTGGKLQPYEVFVVDAKTRKPLQGAVVEMFKEGAPASAVIRGTSNAVGIATIKATSGPHAINTQMMGYEPSGRKLDLDPRKHRIIVEMHRGELQPYEVLVVDAKTRKPLQGAVVEMFKEGAPASAVIRGTSNALGIATIKATSGPHAINTQMMGYEPSGRKLDLDPRKHRIIVEMYRDKPDPPSQKTIQIAIHVIDAVKKAPIAGAKVILRKENTALADAERGTTSAQGTVTLLAQSAGEYTVLAQAEGYQPGGEKMQMEANQKYESNIFLKPTSSPVPADQMVTVTGFVVVEDGTSPTGFQGITNAKLSWQLVSDSSRGNGAVSQRGGSFSVQVPEGIHQVQVTPPSGYRSLTKTVEVSRGMKAQYFILRRATDPVPMVTVTGFVVVPDRTSSTGFRGIANAKLLWRRVGDTSSGIGAVSRTDGSFSVQVLEGSHQVQVTPSRDFLPQTETVDVRRGMGSVRLVVKRRIHPDPDPSRALTLSLSIMEPVRPPMLGPWRPLPGADIQITQNGRIVATGRSDERGGYSTKVKPGSYSIKTSHKGHKAAVDQVTLSTISVLRKIVLQRESGPLPGKAMLTVQVVRSVYGQSGLSRIPIPGAQVTIMKSGTRSTFGTTDSNGYYRMSLAPGSYSVKASAQGYDNKGASITMSTSPYNTVLVLTKSSGGGDTPQPSRKATLTIKVVQRSTSSALPIPGAYITVMQSGTNVAMQFMGTANSKGYYQTSLTPGRYSIKASARGFDDSRSSTVMMGTSSKSHTIALTKSGGGDTPQPSKKATLTIRAVQRSAAPISSAQITIMKGNTRAAFGTTDSKGYYHVSLTPGSYSVKASARGYDGSRSSVVSMGTTNKSHTIVLTKSGGGDTPQPSKKATLTIRAVQRSARSSVPITGAQITVMKGGARMASGTTDSKGYYHVSLTPGSYSVKASARGFESRGALVTMSTSNKSQTLTLTKSGGGDTPQPSKKATLTIHTVTRISARSSAPITGAQITVMKGSTRMASGTTDSKGYYRVSLTSGRYTVKASARGFVTGSSAVSMGTSNVTREIYLVGNDPDS